MNTLRYFILNEQYGDMKHIGTVVANNDDELNVKVKQALETHFEYEMKTMTALKIDEIVYARQGSVYFEVVVNSELFDEDDNRIGNDNEDSRSIEISQTWLY